MHGNYNQWKMTSLKTGRIWWWKKRLQNCRWCYTSCLGRWCETLPITAFHDSRNTAVFTSEWLNLLTWVRFFLGTESYSFAGHNASTMLNASWVGTNLQCTFNWLFPKHLEQTVLLCLRASIATLIHGIGFLDLPMIYASSWHYFCLVDISLS